MRVCSFPDPPVVLELDVVYDCVSVVANWTTFYAGLCPITGYSVNISGIVMLLAADRTTYSQPTSKSDCGTTLDIQISSNTVLWTSSITSQSITIVCTRELGIEHACCHVHVEMSNFRSIFRVKASGLQFLKLLKCVALCSTCDYKCNEMVMHV